MADNPEIKPESQTDGDLQAIGESHAIKRQDLDADKQRNEHGRQENLRTVFAVCVNITITLVFGLICTALLVVAFHYLAPEDEHWVNPDKIKTVSTILFSGTLFAFLGLYVRDRV